MSSDELRGMEKEVDGSSDSSSSTTDSDEVHFGDFIFLFSIPV